MALWRNWHTRRSQEPVPQGVWVQIPPGLLVERGAPGVVRSGSSGTAIPGSGEGSRWPPPPTSRDLLTGSWLVSSAEERRLHTARVGGSNPSPATGSLRGDPRRWPRRPESVDLDNSIHGVLAHRWKSACLASKRRGVRAPEAPRPDRRRALRVRRPGHVGKLPPCLRSSAEEHQPPELVAGGSNPLGDTRCRAGRYMPAAGLIGSPRGPAAAVPPSGGPSTHAGVAHVGPEHLSCKQADAGSIPVTSSFRGGRA